MKHRILTTGLILAALAMVAGCGDDDECPICPGSTQTAVAVGRVYLYNGQFKADGDVVGVSGQEITLDSVVVEGRKATVEESMVGYSSRHFNSVDSSPEVVSGDTVEVRFYTPGGVSSARTKVLSVNDDGIFLTSGYQIYDSGATASFVWNSSPHADWYCVETSFQYLDSTGAAVDRHHTSIRSLNDTTLTIPGDSLAYHGTLSVTLRVGVGNDPTSSIGNITGGTIRGNISSSIMAGYVMQVGNGVGAAVGAYELQLDGTATPVGLQELLERFQK